jgi:hypothetical protein
MAKMFCGEPNILCKTRETFFEIRFLAKTQSMAKSAKVSNKFVEKLSLRTLRDLAFFAGKFYSILDRHSACRTEA